MSDAHSAGGDEFDDENDAREALLHELRTVGAQAAYQALLDVCRDQKAPAPARATSGTSLLRAAGYFQFNRDEDGHGKKPMHLMSVAEMDREIRRLQKQSAGRRRSARRESDDVFD